MRGECGERRIELNAARIYNSRRRTQRDILSLSLRVLWSAARLALPESRTIRRAMATHCCFMMRCCSAQQQFASPSRRIFAINGRFAAILRLLFAPLLAGGLNREHRSAAFCADEKRRRLPHARNRTIKSFFPSLFLRSSFFSFIIFRQFNVVLREDPSSIFSPDVQIENTLGPLNYDVSRVYSGTLEGTYPLCDGSETESSGAQPRRAPATNAAVPSVCVLLPRFFSPRSPYVFRFSSRFGSVAP